MVDFFSFAVFFSAGFFSAFGAIGIKRENMKVEIESGRSGGELMLKQQFEALIQENAFLKQAVAIQHECQKEFEDRGNELNQLKQSVAQYQVQLRTLEVNNYALSMHLKQAQQSKNSIPGRFNPDVFYYTLFNMFDDLILLAKGGLVVYHGPVKKVEDYFAGLGIEVPERVNPPDYFIDILEGLVKPSISSNVNYKELPVLWMLHNGYSVPPEMQRSAAALASSPVELNIDTQAIFDHVTEENSFAGEMWQDMKTNVERQRDIILHNFMRSKDLSHRRTPNVLLQYKYFIGRLSKQRLREAKMQAIDYLILLVAGACLGSLTKVRDESFGAPGYTHTIIAVSLLCKIAALRTFGLDKLQYWRESASGISSIAHFVAKDTIDHFNTVIKPAVYLSMFYFFCNPRSSFADNYVVLLCLVYCVTGMGYTFAIFLAPGPSQLCSVLVPVVLTLVASRTDGGKFLKILADLCYPKWALEAFVIANAERYYGVWLITRCGALMSWGYSLHDWSLCLCILLLIGLGSRIIAFFGMLSFQRK
ncbi:hypothetical protein MTR67_018822 [Solanum verrucosum]|uniref:ABC transporter family G domain-containing protein n=1 Tax=Solanum verrucosum TaxID=315347 RepID=A0AAF0QKD3_SOLVR|nr:hypothetical protein MTR67_018822 [Solanum verrucosum]